MYKGTNLVMNALKQKKQNRRREQKCKENHWKNLCCSLVGKDFPCFAMMSML